MAEINRRTHQQQWVVLSPIRQQKITWFFSALGKRPHVKFNMTTKTLRHTNLSNTFSFWLLILAKRKCKKRVCRSIFTKERKITTVVTTKRKENKQFPIFFIWLLLPVFLSLLSACVSACEKSTDALAKAKGYDDDHESWYKMQGIKKHRFYFLKQKKTLQARKTLVVKTYSFFGLLPYKYLHTHQVVSDTCRIKQAWNFRLWRKNKTVVWNKCKWEEFF